MSKPLLMKVFYSYEQTFPLRAMAKSIFIR